MGWHAQVQQLLLTRPLSVQLRVGMQVTAVHKDLTRWAGGSWKRGEWCWPEPGPSAGCLQHLGLGWVPGRQGWRPGD